MTKFVDEVALAQLVKKEIARSNHSTLAVAFWGNGAIELLGINEHNARSIDVICNLTTGGTNPEEIKRLMALGVHVKHSERLHGKVYLFERTLVVGSSNASSNGLALQAGQLSGWREANIVSKSRELREQLKGWVDSLSTLSVSSEDLQLARRMWSASRMSHTGSKPQSLLTKMRQDPAFFDGKEVYVAFYTSSLTPAGKKELDYRRREFGSELEAFEQWLGLPDNGFIIGFWSKPNNFYCENLYLRQKNPADIGRLNFLWPVACVYGLTVPTKDFKSWQIISKRVIGSEYWDEDGALVPIEALIEKFLS